MSINYAQNFEEELSNIDKLEQTPNRIKEAAIFAINQAISVPGLLTTSKIALENHRQSLENIDDSSIANNFKVIYAQMCILAVSSLEANLKKYFEDSLNDPTNINRGNSDLLRLKLTVGELLENNLNFGGKFGKLVLDKASLNFQDLKSIKRIFSEYLSREVTVNKDVEKKICFFLELRHVLVHRGGKVDEKFVTATESFEANLKSYRKGSSVEINSEDWQDIKNSFKILVDKITKNT